MMPPSKEIALRPRVRGKFFFVGNEKLYIRGVTYGPFRPDAHGNEYHDPESVEKDFALIAASGMNAIRTYTVPPRWLLDIAQRHGLRVMVGLPWEQHVTFLDVKGLSQNIIKRICAGVRSCAGHPAVLCYAIGNEIPAPIVRWHGHQRIECFLERAYWAAKAEDPGALFAYVNYPSTEYLELPFVEVVCFNVFLESQDRLAAYLARLHNLAGDRPLILAEAWTACGTGRESRRTFLIGRCGRRSHRAVLARSFLIGPTSGSAAVSTSRTGALGLLAVIGNPNQPSKRCGAHSPTFLSHPICLGRAFP